MVQGLDKPGFPAVKPGAKPNRVASAVAGSPVMLAIVKMFRESEDSGVGDTLARLLGGRYTHDFIEWFTALGGSTCGCSDAVVWLNRKHPYSN